MQKTIIKHLNEIMKQDNGCLVQLLTLGWQKEKLIACRPGRDDENQRFVFYDQEEDLVEKG